MKTYLYNLIVVCLTLFAPLCFSYRHESHNATHSLPLTHTSKTSYNLSCADWKQTMLNIWSKQQKTLSQKLNYIFEQIHRNPANQTIIFYNYNLARALFNKPEIKSLELFQAQFDKTWWHDLVDQYNVGCPCVYLACLGTLPRIAMLINQIHKNPMDEQIIFENYNIARELYGKSTITSIEQFKKQFDKPWWKGLVNEFHIEHERALEKHRTIESRLSSIAVYELLGLAALFALIYVSSSTRPSPIPPVMMAAPAAAIGIAETFIDPDFLAHNFAMSPAAGA